MQLKSDLLIVYKTEKKTEKKYTKRPIFIAHIVECFEDFIFFYDWEKYYKKKEEKKIRVNMYSFYWEFTLN